MRQSGGGWRAAVRAALGLALTSALWAQVEYLPLEPGNRWVYRGSAGQFTLAVERRVVFEGREYSLVRGFPATPELYLRMDEEGRVRMWDRDGRRERMWLDFTAREAPAGVDPCNPLSRVESREANYSGPVGEFVNALRVGYTFGGCADAGIERDVFLPYVGLVRRTVVTIAGPREYDLVYARLGEIAVVTEPEVKFGVAVERSGRSVRLMLRNTTGKPLELEYSSGQMYEVVVRDERGGEIWRWSDGRAFTQALMSELVSGERLWVVALPDLKAGRYTVEGWLTTTGGRRFAATVGLDVGR